MRRSGSNYFVSCHSAAVHHRRDVCPPASPPHPDWSSGFNLTLPYSNRPPPPLPLPFLFLLLMYFLCSGCVHLDMNVAHFIMEIRRYLTASPSRYLSPSLFPPPHPPPHSVSLSRQVHLLRTAGDEVTITVRYLREVPSFLKLPLGKNPSAWSATSSISHSHFFFLGPIRGVKRTQRRTT